MEADPGRFDRPRRDQAVYGISVAAELLSVAPQTLRVYEARGLVEPSRTAGGTRRYSDDDLDRVRRIGELLAAGLNLAGVREVLEIELENRRLRAELDEARERLDRR
ncbi:MerR family transcriptional regulator [Glycomyces xiaoerkulensis]|uniref:MerR family transcriptional regulator n=1 Tax=Glycomyces xiaoerkulensis TaxID=2038139 RepID=UPI000C2661F1|nr:MerR family transcriptional regulator [Glycomyces xiaoerkulensis]